MSIFSIRRRIKQLTVLCLCAFLSACAGNSLVLGLLYDRVDTQIINAFEAYATLTEDQQTWLRGEVANFHQWHRTTQLPAYADWLDNSVTPLVQKTEPDVVDVDAMFNDVMGFVDQLNLRFPLNRSPAILRTATDGQILEARAHVDNLVNEASEQRDDRTPEQRMEERVTSVARAFRQIGWQLNDEQRQIVRDTSVQREDQSVEESLEDWDLWYTWMQELFAMMEDRDAPEFVDRIKQHLLLGGKLRETRRPEAYQQDIDRFQAMAVSLLQSMESEQRLAVTERVTRIAEILRELSQQT